MLTNFLIIVPISVRALKELKRLMEADCAGSAICRLDDDRPVKLILCVKLTQRTQPKPRFKASCKKALKTTDVLSQWDTLC